jgi:hypothetical protein
MFPTSIILKIRVLLVEKVLLLLAKILQLEMSHSFFFLLRKDLFITNFKIRTNIDINHLFYFIIRKYSDY